MTPDAHARAAALIESLGLRPHPEGGHYREIHRSSSDVQPADGRAPRAALTAIYFLLQSGEHSAWHRVLSDETWHHHEGAALDLHVADPALGRVTTQALGVHDEAARTEPVRVVPAGWWQAASTTGVFTLVSCTVGPGFEFGDFALLRDLPAQAAVLRTSQPQHAALL